MLVSPLSALYALGMTANGAKGETLSQMESMFGLTVGELDAYLGALARDFPDQEGCRLDLANSLWIKDSEDFAVEPAFLQAMPTITVRGRSWRPSTTPRSKTSTPGRTTTRTA